MGSVVDQQPMVTAPKKPLYDVETDAKGPPNKQKKSNSSSATPAKAKPPASAAVSKAQITGVIPEVASITTNAASLVARGIPLIIVGNRRM